MANLQKFQENYQRKVRNTAGEVFLPSKETKRVWREVGKAKRIDSFERRVANLIELIGKDIWSVRNDNRMSKGIRYNRETGKHEITSSKGGQTGSPKLVISTKWSATLGHFHAGLMTNFEIMLIKRSLKEMRATLLHELTHWIDHLSSTRQTHDTYFLMRIDDLEKRLGGKK